MHRRFISALVITVAASAGAAHGQSALSLGPLFQDHAVLQRDTPIPIWGTAGPGDQVTIAFAGRQATVRADASGRWTATLPAVGRGGPYRLDVHAGAGASRTVADVLVGDVFLCSGQSNMEMSVAQSRGGEFVASHSANDRIRLLTVAHVGEPAPATTFEAMRTVAGGGAEECAELFGGLLLLRPRRGGVAGRPGGTRPRVVGRNGHRAVGRRVRTAGDRRIRRPTRPAAALRDRRGRGQPGFRDAVGGLVARARCLRRGTMEARRSTGPWTDVPGLRRLEDLGCARSRRPTTGWSGSAVRSA